MLGKGRPCPCFRDFTLEPWRSAVAAFMATHGGPCDYREIRSEGLLVQEGFGCCDAGRTACCNEVGLARLFEDLPAMLSVFFVVAASAGCMPGCDFLDPPRHVFYGVE